MNVHKYAFNTGDLFRRNEWNVCHQTEMNIVSRILDS